MKDRCSAELLQIIAEMIGTDLAVLEQWRRDHPARGDGDNPAELHHTMLLFRMIRAFRALPDETTRLRALEHVETMAAHPIGPH